MSKLTITKTRTTKYRIIQVIIDFTIFNERFRDIRGSFKYKGFECHACNKHFFDGEKISLIFTDKGNKTVCAHCAIEMKRELEEGVNKCQGS